MPANGAFGGARCPDWGKPGHQTPRNAPRSPPSCSLRGAFGYPRCPAVAEFMSAISWPSLQSGRPAGANAPARAVQLHSFELVQLTRWAFGVSRCPGFTRSPEITSPALDGHCTHRLISAIVTTCP